MNKEKYKIEYEITGLTKKEAIDFINEIHSIYNDRFLTTKAIRKRVKADYGVKNQRTKYYTYDLNDKY